MSDDYSLNEFLNEVDAVREEYLAEAREAAREHCTEIRSLNRFLTEFQLRAMAWEIARLRELESKDE